MDILDRISFFFCFKYFHLFIYLFLSKNKNPVIKTYLFMAVLCPAAGPSGCSKVGGHSPAGARGLTCFRCGAWAQHVSSEVVVHRPSVPKARGVLLDQGSNQSPCIGRQTVTTGMTREVPTPYYLRITDACLPGNLRFLTSDSCSQEVKGPSSRKIWRAPWLYFTTMVKFQSSP